jgi:pimeloyl-ACP methyl ester carboxylesterase
MQSKKGTTVRARPVGNIAWWRHLCRWLSRISNTLAARLVSWLFLRPPPRQRLPLRAQLVLAAGQRLEVAFQDTSLGVWRWGRGPVVLLVHGWGGSAGQLQAFVQPLVSAGFTVVAFDAPGHGVSGGTWASLPRLAAAVTHVAETVGPVHAIIAHSLGGPAAGLALGRGLHVERLVEIGPPSDAARWFHSHAQALGLSAELEHLAQRQVEHRLGMGLEELDAEHIGSAIDVPVLVVHDRLDREVPWVEGARVARSLRLARLMSTLGLGHRRILSEPAVIQASERFVMQGHAVARSGRSFGSLPLPAQPHSMDVPA